MIVAEGEMTKREKIERLGLSNPAVHAYLELHWRGMSWTEMLEELTLHLAKSNDLLAEHAIDAEMRAMPRPLIVPSYQWEQPK